MTDQSHPDSFHTQAAPEAPDERLLVLKHNDSFVICDERADIEAVRGGRQGLYLGATRHLSRWRTRVNGRRPLLLNSAVTRDDTAIVADLMSPEVPGFLRSGAVHVSRVTRLWNGALAHRLVLTNYERAPVRIQLTMEFGSDFADIFEVRGMHRERRGEGRMLGHDHGLVLEYAGLDGLTRRTLVACDPAPARIEGNVLEFRFELGPWQGRRLDISISPDRPEGALAAHFEGLGRNLDDSVAAEASRQARVTSANELMGEWLQRSRADLRSLITDTNLGEYPFAGVPWYSCPFGRDGIITALEMLWVEPAIARGVLAFLAATQATDVIPEQDAEPGKILHEMRRGELAALGEIPFGRYYGTIDATPLFVLLAGAYYQRTGDRDFLEAIWPNIERALAWIDTYGDRDGDGFVEYIKRSAQGLVQQGWKDSVDSIFHADGALAEPPIALCEVQAYVYGAKLAAAELATVFGLAERATALRQQAATLRATFEQAFWCEELDTYALALDGAKRPCRVRASNAGHALFSGIARPERAAAVAKTLTSNAFFSVFAPGRASWSAACAVVFSPGVAIATSFSLMRFAPGSLISVLRPPVSFLSMAMGT